MSRPFRSTHLRGKHLRRRHLQQLEPRRSGHHTDPAGNGRIQHHPQSARRRGQIQVYPGQLGCGWKATLPHYLPDRVLTYNGQPTTVNVSILTWEDLSGGGNPNSTAAANVFILDDHFYMPQLNRDRRIWMYFAARLSDFRQKISGSVYARRARPVRHNHQFFRRMGS